MSNLQGVSCMADAGAGDAGIDTFGMVNPTYSTPSASDADPQGSRLPPIACMYRCFDGITREDLGPEDNRASESDEN